MDARGTGPLPRLALALAVLVPAAACHRDDLGPPAPPAHDVVIVPGATTAGAGAFAPTDPVISLAVQNTVVWYNADAGSYGGAGSAHRLASDDAVTFQSGTIQPGGTFQATFSAPGTYTYHCQFHEGMTGTITVLP